jgi:lipopolysaccharide biosynthesis protein
LFGQDKRLGLVFPPYYGLKKNQPDWGANREGCQKLYAALTGEALPHRCPDYPVGSFFWARTQYLAPLFSLNITEGDFPEEMNQGDGTLAHSIERVVGLLDKPSRMSKQCVSVDPPLSLDDLAGMGP